MTGATGNLYCGLHDFCDMGFLLHFLRADDVFIDVGANVGSYTILASAEIGARTISIEPVPSTFAFLKKNVLLNNVDRLVEALNIGLAGKSGSIKFTRSLDTVNHVATSGETDVIEVHIATLDKIAKGITPCLIKIDVEGYEYEVLRGAYRTLAESSLQGIIIELNGSGKRYGFDDDDVHQQLMHNDFSPFNYDPLTRVLSPINTFGSHNTIYIRDIDFVSQRVRGARKIKVSGVNVCL
jgi:FkbM family methyltransferase